MSSSIPVVSPAPGRRVSDKEWRLKVVSLIQEAFKSISKSSFLRGKWFTDDGIIQLIKQRYAFDDINGIHLSLFNKAMDQLFPHIESPDPDINNTGIYRVPRTIQLPPDEGEGKRLVRFYYITDPGSGIATFPQQQAKSDWTSLYCEAIANASIRLGRSAPKRMKHWDAVDSTIFDYKVAYFQSETNQSSASRPQHESNAQQACPKPTFWESTEARNLFVMASTSDESGDALVEDVLDQQIEKLELVSSILRQPSSSR